MWSPPTSRDRPKSTFVRHPVAAFFVLTFAISWAGAFVLAAPHLFRHESLPKLTGVLLFPVMLLGPSIAGILLAGFTGGRAGLTDLRDRLTTWCFAPGWYATLLVPPFLILSVLSCLAAFVNPAYAPNRFFMGLLFGIPAGLLEEIGWMGYAFPRMSSQVTNSFVPATLLGLLWGTWHIPVIDFLGTAGPHNGYWLSFFLAFTTAMTAIRVLICWVYANTRSVLSSQLMHISSTSSLVVFSPPRVSAAEEVAWYLLYALTLWLVVAIVLKVYGKSLTRPTT